MSLRVLSKEEEIEGNRAAFEKLNYGDLIRFYTLESNPIFKSIEHYAIVVRKLDDEAVHIIEFDKLNKEQIITGGVCLSITRSVHEMSCLGILNKD